VTALARGGHIVTIGLQGGVKGELNLGALLSKNGTISATSLRFRPVPEKAAIVAELTEHVWPLIAQHEVWPCVDSVFELADVAKAHRLVAESTHQGKVILKI
jgi:NADPH:quinone reductase-like Zn-dependent oxidoreductase